MTYQLIETKTLGTAAAAIEFTSIPGTYTDLKLVISHRSTGTYGAQTSYLNTAINGVTTDRTYRILEGYSGSTTASSSSTGPRTGYTIGTTATADTFASTEIYFPNYSSSSYKSFSVDGVTETNSANADQHIVACLWSSTAAITSLSLTVDSGNLVAGSIASLYGITKGSSGGVVVS
jgi:hypothetical protein